ncbi:MAG: prepilin-type N-terminal cleavage/methylation domain-containing protein [Verrucomicrobiota bacterium]
MKAHLSSQRGFSLLEVMIAMGIFFVAIFGILELTSQNLVAARRLQKTEVDITTLAAQLTLTNRLGRGFESGDFQDLNSDCLWSRTITEVSSNGLFRVDFTLHEPTHNKKAPLVERHLSILLYRPLSAGGGLNLGNRR